MVMTQPVLGDTYSPTAKKALNLRGE